MKRITIWIPAAIVLVAVAAFIVRSGKPASQGEKLGIYVFDGGSIRVANPLVLSLDSNRQYTLGNASFLIVHSKGTLMWDTGFPDHFKDSSKGVVEPLATIFVQKTLQSQLAEIGVTPASVTYLALSHLHNDHTGNANIFQNATLLMQQKDADIAFSDSAAKYFANPQSYNMLKKKNILQNEDFDVFGDGKVIIKYTPGHTAGHQSLFVRLKHYGPVLISGDLYHHEENRAKKLFPVFNHNQQQTLTTAQSVEKWLKAEKVRLWIQHDPAFNSTVKKSPHFWD